ncbi:MAG: hypothetical protein WC860_02450 [Candidatus Margulisiibacteriota bacterium]|jgi:hypothetical protein
MTNSCLVLEKNNQQEIMKIHQDLNYDDYSFDSPWGFDMTTRYNIAPLINEADIENILINHTFQKLTEQNLSFWDNKEDEIWDAL